MKLRDADLNELCDLAVLAASKAALRISETDPASLSVDRKAGAVSLAAAVVSQLDRDAQEIILSVLQESVGHFDLALLAEESEDSRERFEKDYFWCIDPLDGTLPFLEGKPGYAVSIALVSREGLPMLGVVVDPLTGNRLQAIRGGGAYLNGGAFRVGERKGPLNLFTDRSMMTHPLFDLCVNRLGAVHVHEPAGAVMNVCNMLKHEPACYFKFPKAELGGGSLWDYAATACIIREAGGVVTDLHGGPLDLNRSDATFMNHRGFLFATDVHLHERVGELLRDISLER
ncbi:inositol monophosphatase family protein [Kiritimatiellota bacterium B12222]|nr:inositol monophosphatase family protein [Kiritimatiellota bacterium B12222]